MPEASTTIWRPRRVGGPPSHLEQRFGALLAKVAWSRGWEEAEALESFLDPRLEQLQNPSSLLNFDRAVQRIHRAITQQEKICVYADYDIDGTAGLAILVSFLRACGAEHVLYRQPDRLREGYGVHPETLREIAGEGCTLVITVDTGTSALEAMEEAQRLGLDFLVTDHHQQLHDIPDGPCVVNPNQRGDTSKLKYLSGTGVAFYTCIGIRSLLRESGWFHSQRPQPDLRLWLDLFVLGTIADQVALEGDNRALVRAGLKQLARSTRPGLAELRSRVLPEAAAHGLSAQDVAFSLTPKLNAASRMGQAELSTELLLTNSPEQAFDLTEKILSLNSQRSNIQKEIYAQAEQQARNCSLPVLLVHGDWHEGVLGIVAAKLVETFHRPAIVLARPANNEEALRGSMRTLPGVSCLKVLEHCQTALTKFGGHDMAAGLQLSYAKLPLLEESISSADFLRDALPEAHEIAYDGVLDAQGNLLLDDIRRLEHLGPWGQGNPEPLFLAQGMDLAAYQVLKEKHVKLKLSTGSELIGFFLASRMQELREEGHQKFDALLHATLHRFRGRETVQYKVAHVRAHQSQDSLVGS